jgi:hypothetical protein
MDKRASLVAAIFVAGCAATSEPADRPVTAATFVGRWDLQTVDHRRLPVATGASRLTGESTYVVEGHLILESDGTYRRWSVNQVPGHARRDSVIFVSSYTFQATPTPSITLRINPPINEGSGVFENGVLSFTYTDFLNWWDDTFVRSP